MAIALSAARARVACPGCPLCLRKTLLFLLLTAGYFSLHLVLRWLRYPLFHGAGPNRWPPPSTGDLLLHIYSGCLPAFAWGLALYGVARLFPRFVNRPVLALIFFIALAMVELDMAWYGMSEHHVTWHEAHAFLTESWGDHFGVQRSDLLRFAGHMGMHALLLLFLAALSTFLAQRRALQWLSPRWGVLLGAAVALLFVLDGLVVRVRLSREVAYGDRSMWRHLITRNPLRVRFVEGLVSSWSGQGSDLREANEALASLPAPSAQSADAGAGLPLPPPRKGWRPNVLFLVVESFSFRLQAATDMPHWKALAEQSVRLERHYSVGNCTHYALAGLLHGAPVSFFHGKVSGPEPRSPYLDLFARQGYRSKRLASTPLDFFHLESYLSGFTEPSLETRAHDLLLAPLHEELARPGGSFVLAFYYGPHFPYVHSPKFTAHQPEVAEDYDYTAWDLLANQEAIANRYRNCLAELDSWLGALLRQVDLDNTILVVTGDHGEEMFETGRLGHASTLEDAQVHTPCLLHVPGLHPGRVSFITSHADLMPTIVDALGWQQPQGWRGRSLFRQEPGRGAVVAHTELAYAPRRWLVVTRAGKAFAEGTTGEPVRITNLRDLQDEPLSFQDEPARWRANLHLLRQLQESLAEQP